MSLGVLFIRRYKLDDVEDEIVDHLLIEVGEEGNYRLQGQVCM